jgi:hypothetical protein
MKISIGLATYNSSKIVCKKHDCDLEYEATSEATEPIDLSGVTCKGLNTQVNRIRTQWTGNAVDLQNRIDNATDECTLSWDL